MKTITIHIDKQLLKQVKQAAKRLNLTLSEFVNMALKEKLKELQNGGQI
jgi:antitoxin component of RelBE/YafQ-DinJ toxin-antitoxin module